MEPKRLIPDPKGYFVIYPDHPRKRLVLEHYIKEDITSLKTDMAVMRSKMESFATKGDLQMGAHRNRTHGANPHHVERQFNDCFSWHRSCHCPVHEINPHRPRLKCFVEACHNPSVQAGVDLPTVKRISGHKTLIMVERYSHQNGAHIQVAMDKLQERILASK